ncbi:MAG TPA: ABC transporter substrate-binding protein [Azospirillaceae bacterium]|nr:ABC transporter substrate-binding protein [Azospirillaceae bacterium]
MRRRFLAIAAALPLLLAAPAVGAAEARLHLVTEENPPYNYTDPATGKLAGLAGDMIPKLMERAGIAYDIEVLPWNRAYAKAQTETDTCVFVANPTPERMPLFKWIRPLAEGGWMLFARPDWQGEIRSIEDLKGRSVIVQAGGALEEWMKRQGIAVNPVPMRSILPMLMNGRAELAALGAYGGPWMAREAGLSVKQAYRLTSAELGMACSLTTSDALVGKLRAALESLRADGTAEAIAARYR